MTEAEDRAAGRVEKAASINAEVSKRLHQNDAQPGITEKPAPKKSAKKPADE